MSLAKFALAGQPPGGNLLSHHMVWQEAIDTHSCSSYAFLYGKRVLIREVQYLIAEAPGRGITNNTGKPSPDLATAMAGILGTPARGSLLQYGGISSNRDYLGNVHRFRDHVG